MFKITVLGVDQGIASCGYALIDLTFDDNEKYILKVLESGLISTDSKKSMGNRTLKIVKKLENLIEDNKPMIIGCEKLFFNSASRGRNKSASMLYTNMATGLLQYLSGKHGIPVAEFVPGTVKKQIAGCGRATKEEMIEAIEHLISDQDIDIKKNEHIADAISIAITAGLTYYSDRLHYEKLTDCIENNKNIPKKIKFRKLKKSEKTKLEKMRSIKDVKSIDISVIHKSTNIPRNTIKKYLKEIDEGVLDELEKIEKGVVEI